MSLEPAPAAESVAAKLHATTDASVWAREFVRIVVETEPGVTVDFGLMVGWFANAIETGRAAGRTEHSDGRGVAPYPCVHCGSTNPCEHDEDEHSDGQADG